MSIKINSNKRSLNSQRAFARNRALLDKIYEQLSSGKRINSAADDAAGLSIATRFTSQIRGLNQSVRNASDGISQAQTADSALGGATEALQRIRELSIQSANGTLNRSDRRAIQAEVDQLTDQLGDLGVRTSFNGRNLLDGSPGGNIQVGPNAGETIALPSIDLRSGRLGAGAETTSGQIDASGLQAGELSINGIDIRATQDDGVSTAQGAGSAIAVADAVNDVSASTGVTATVEAAQVSGAAAGGGTLDQNNSLVINGQAIVAEVSADDANDGLLDAINAASDDTGVTASRNQDGGIDLTAADGRNIDVQTTGTAAATTGLNAGVTTGSVTLRSDEQFTVGGSSAGDAGLTAGVEGVSPNTAVSQIDLTTAEGASNALFSIDRALEQVGSARGRLGAVQNRFESTIRNLGARSENLTAARSRIEDADFASAVSELARRSALEQANIFVQAQANVSNSTALRLLGGA